MTRDEFIFECLPKYRRRLIWFAVDLYEQALRRRMSLHELPTAGGQVRDRAWKIADRVVNEILHGWIAADADAVPAILTAFEAQRHMIHIYRRVVAYVLDDAANCMAFNFGEPDEQPTTDGDAVRGSEQGDGGGAQGDAEGGQRAQPA